jgi:histidinol-phosphate aminotransferase
MSIFLNPDIEKMTAYVPGEQPRDQEYIKLNTNESPFPPPAAVLDAVSREEVARLRLYPEPDCTALIAALAKEYGVSPKSIILGNGSDEILNFCFLAFFSAKQKLLFPDITYGFYRVFADLYRLPYTEVPLRDDFTIDPDDYIGKGANIVIANPNAPTGIEMAQDKIEEIVRTNPDHIVVIDEAYVDFGGTSAVPLTEKYPNLVVVMTFSKSRSLAGGRVGFAIANEALIRDLKTVKYSTNPYNINRLSQAAALASVMSSNDMRANCKTIVSNREYLADELSQMGFAVLPSKTNFLFAKSDRIGGQALYLALKQRGVLVRHFGAERISDFVRITVGTREQIDTLLLHIRNILKGD